MKAILGISAFYHDSAAAIVVDGKVVAAAQEERFTRIKHTAEFPIESIKYCLLEAGIELNDLDAVVFYDKPFLKFERLLETYYAFAPKGLLNFIKAMPIWLNEKLFLKKRIYDELKKVADIDKRKTKLLFSEHHLSHAASAFYPSPYHKSAILTIDGVGEWCTASIGVGENGRIQLLKEMMFPHSVGLLYSAFTYYLGFTVNSGEYKLMGLAPYGEGDALETKRFIQLIKEQLVSIKEDGSIWLNQKYFNYATGLRMVHENKWKALFGFGKRLEENELQQHHCNLALAIQTVTEEIVLKMAYEAKRLTGADYLCMAGGVALNCVANGKLLKENIFKAIYIQPAAGDAGGALGAALAVNYMYYAEPRVLVDGFDGMEGTYLGPGFSQIEIQQMNRKVSAVAKHFQNFEELTQFVASKIAEKNIVGWFQGRMEFGPRALGNRSILADVRDEGTQKKLNLNIKYREGFRPFAPSVLAEYASNYFDLNSFSPYMLFVAPIRKELQKKLPEHYNQLSVLEKLYVTRSEIQAVTHVDFSARVQTVHKETNWRYWELINAYYKQTGFPLVVNTSFNVRGEPVVCSPFDAYQCFMATEMDYLVIDNFVYCKTEQAEWQKKEKWTKTFTRD
jgi:carbamoyltransferase